MLDRQKVTVITGLALAAALYGCGGGGGGSSLPVTSAGSGTAPTSTDTTAQPTTTTPTTTTTTPAVNPMPSTYPASWNVIYKPAKALPATYEFGRKTTILPAGSTYITGGAPMQCDVVWERDIPVTLRDGTVIYTDVLMPAATTEKLPAIVAWSPYGKTLPSSNQPGVNPAFFSGMAKSEGADAAYWACKGYALVNPDARGAGKSGGNIAFWGSIESGDGYDVIEWAAAQSWSSGKVALHGTSWLAVSQWGIAAAKPPHLTAIAPWNGFSDIYRDSLTVGGIPNPIFNSLVESGFTGPNMFESTSAMINADPLWNDYWADKAAKLENITIPAYVATDGVTTLHRPGTLNAFRRIASKEKWLRINDTTEWIDQYDPDNDADLLKFFDHYLKGISNGWENTAKIRATVLDPGGTNIKNVPYADWPVPNTHYQKLYLDATNGSLKSASATTESSASYAATTGQATFQMAFTQDTQVTGHLKARLFVEASGNDDMDLFVLVEKLDSAGNVLVASQAAAQTYLPIPPPGAPGRLRVSLRELDPNLSTDYLPVGTFKNPQKLSAGQIVPVDISIQGEAMLWHAGQQIRITVAGNPIKEQLPTPNLNAGTHIIHTGGQYPSYLQIPLVSAASL